MNHRRGGWLVQPLKEGHASLPGCAAPRFGGNCRGHFDKTKQEDGLGDKMNVLVSEASPSRKLDLKPIENVEVLWMFERQDDR